MFTFMFRSRDCHLIQQRQTFWSKKTIVSVNFECFHVCAATTREGGTGERFRAGTRVFSESSLETNGQIRDREKVGIHKIINNNAKQERYSKKCVVDQNNFSGILLCSISINYFCSKTALYPLEKITICWVFFNDFLFFYLLGLWSDC